MSRALFVDSHNNLKEAYSFQDVEKNGVKALACADNEESLHFFDINGIGMFVEAPHDALESIERQLKKAGIDCFFYEADISMVDETWNEVAATHLYTEDGVYYEVFWF